MNNPDYQKTVDRFARRGRPLPDSLPTPPDILPGYESWVEAFLELGTERQMGFAGMGPIPRSAIVDYSKGWPQAEADFFYKTIRAIDRAYLAHGTEYEELPPEIEVSDNPARDSFRASMRGRR